MTKDAKSDRRVESVPTVGHGECTEGDGGIGCTEELKREAVKKSEVCETMEGLRNNREQFILRCRAQQSREGEIGCSSGLGKEFQPQFVVRVVLN